MEKTNWQHRDKDNLVPGYYVMNIDKGPSWLKGPFDSMGQARAEKEENCIAVEVSKNI